MTSVVLMRHYGRALRNARIVLSRMILGSRAQSFPGTDAGCVLLRHDAGSLIGVSPREGL